MESAKDDTVLDFKFLLVVDIVFCGMAQFMYICCLKGPYHCFLCSCLLLNVISYVWIFPVFFAGVLFDCERCDEMLIRQNTNKFLSEMGKR
jgi:hypothetical protein